ncbi:hypothetical protein [Thalassiella azotivora]
MTGHDRGAPAGSGVTLVVDVANVLGARPDGWWRDRARASERLVAALARLPGRVLGGPDARQDPLRVDRVVAVLEGRARGVPVPDGVVAVRTAGSGDDALVEHVAGAAGPVVVVTADRGLRRRLPAGVRVLGPGGLRDELDRLR